MESYNFVLPSHGNPIVLDWIKEGKAVFQPGPLETPCLVWKGKTSHGYGFYFIKNKGLLSSRVHREAISCSRLENALHSCHNKPCCNPLHLRKGTIAENNADTRIVIYGSADPKHGRCQLCGYGMSRFYDKIVCKRCKIKSRGW